MKKILALLLVLCLLSTLFIGRTVSASAEEEDGENYETGDASLDDPLNQDGIGEKELLVVSFGTSLGAAGRVLRHQLQ